MVSKGFVELSVIVPTVGRQAELIQLLQSIQEANFSFNYEILIVDQNKVGYLDDVLERFNDLPLHHHLVDFKGLSKAKNFGIDKCVGDIICFPDDDCKFYTNTVHKAFEMLLAYELDMVFGKCVDELGKDSVLAFKDNMYFLNKDNMLGGFVEATVFVKREVLIDWKFDENLGAGSFFGAEEGYDWLYRIITKSRFNKIAFSPEIIFYHPQVILRKGDLASLNRVFKYSCGTGYLCFKHKLWKKFYKRLLLVKVASFLYGFFNKEKANYYRAESLGLQTGKVFSKKYL